MRISVHVLDTYRGTVGAGVPVSLLDPSGNVLASASTDHDGRIPELFAEDPGVAVAVGSHRILFDVSGLWADVEDRLIEAVEVHVRLGWPVPQDGPPEARDEHLHVPLLAGPYAATTYRGS